MANLDVGAIERIMKGEGACANFKPVVQVINIRQIGGVGDAPVRFRLVISDSRHWSQSMAASQLNEMLSSSIQVGEFIRLVNYTVNNVQNKRIIIVLGIQQLGTGPSERIGQPDAYSNEAQSTQFQPTAIQPSYPTMQQPPMTYQQPSFQPQTNMQQPQQQDTAYQQQNFQPQTVMQQPVHQEVPYQKQQALYQQQPQQALYQQQPQQVAYQQQPQQAPYQQQQRLPLTGMNHNIPMPRPGPPAAQKGGTESGDGFQRIAQLNPYIQRFTIKARVITKGDMKTWSKPTSEGKLFAVDLADASGEIRGVCFKELADKLYPIIQEGQTYVITETNARLKSANKQFTSIDHSFEITFGNATFEACGYDDTSIPPIIGNWRTLAQVAAEPPPPGSTLDLIAVVKNAMPLGFITSKKTGKESAKREVTLVDDSGYEIRMTFWGDHAQKPDEFWRASPVVAARGCRVSDFGGLSLSSVWSGAYKFDIYKDQRCKMLRDWFHDQGGKDLRSNPLTMSSSGGGNGGAGLGPVPMSQRGVLDDIKSKDLGMDPDKPDYITFKGTLSFIKTETFSYPACSNEGCSKKVVQSTDGSWFCEKCQATIPDCDYRYMLTTTFLDDTGQAWVSAFNDQALVIFGNVTASQLVPYKEEVEQHDGVFDDYMKSFTNKQFLVKARVKTETWNEVARIKVSMLGITPIDFIAESASMLADIANLKASL